MIKSKQNGWYVNQYAHITSDKNRTTMGCEQWTGETKGDRANQANKEIRPDHGRKTHTYQTHAGSIQHRRIYGIDEHQPLHPVDTPPNVFGKPRLVPQVFISQEARGSSPKHRLRFSLDLRLLEILSKLSRHRNQAGHSFISLSNSIDYIAKHVATNEIAIA
jgi:hypothetical protein